MLFELSNRQRKALFVDRVPVELALPCPAGDVPDVAGWAWGALPADVRPLIRRIEEQEIGVYLIRPRCGAGERETLTHHLGIIDQTEPRPISARPRQLVPIVAVLLAPDSPNQNKAPLPLQWPQSLIYAQRRWPGAAAPQPTEPAPVP